MGFGTSFYLTERMMQKEPAQALSIAAAQVSVTAFISAVWAFCDGYGIGPFDGGWLLDDTLRATHTIRAVPGPVTTRGRGSGGVDRFGHNGREPRRRDDGVRSSDVVGSFCPTSDGAPLGAVFGAADQRSAGTRGHCRRRPDLRGVRDGGAGPGR